MKINFVYIKSLCINNITVSYPMYLALFLYILLKLLNYVYFSHLLYCTF